MCRNIRTLFNFEPPATEEEIRASALQFVRKLSGFTHPSHANEAAFDRAVDEVTDAARRLLELVIDGKPGEEPRGRSDESARTGESTVCLNSQKTLRVDVDLELDRAVPLRRLGEPAAQIGREIKIARRFDE